MWPELMARQVSCRWGFHLQADWSGEVSHPFLTLGHKRGSPGPEHPFSSDICPPTFPCLVVRLCLMKIKWESEALFTLSWLYWRVFEAWEQVISTGVRGRQEVYTPWWFPFKGWDVELLQGLAQEAANFLLCDCWQSHSGKCPYG